MGEAEEETEGLMLTCGECEREGDDHEGVEVISLQELEAVVICRSCDEVLMRLNFTEPLVLDPKPIARLH